MRQIVLTTNIFIILTMTNCSSTSNIIGDRQNLNNSISSIETIEVNGINQCVMIRSYDISNPIILYFHGGPGTSELPLVRYYNSELEKHFTVVYLEQRGTGKSFKRSIFKDTLSIDQFVKDGYILSKYLLQRFNKEKLFIVGHSWGSIIATKLAIQYPEIYYAYVGIGQDVNPLKGEQLSFQYTLSQATKSNNQKAIKALKRINNPYYLTIENNPKWFKQLKTERKWLTYFGGVIYNQTDYKQFTRIYLKSSEYSIFDMVKFAKGSVLSLKKLWPEIMTINLLNGQTEFKIPVYFIQGKYDYNCPTELVKDYYEKVNAPKKELLIFEKSAHNPNFEENQKFNTWIIENLIANE
jgi:pimeloyl-ACP methyl ester carboxylesterase